MNYLINFIYLSQYHNFNDSSDRKRINEKIVLKYGDVQELSGDADSYARFDSNTSLTDHDESLSEAEIRATADEIESDEFEFSNSYENSDSSGKYDDILNNCGFNLQSPKGDRQIAAEAAAARSFYGSQSSESVSVKAMQVT